MGSPVATLPVWKGKDSSLADRDLKYKGTRKPLPNLALASRNELLQGLKKQTEIFPKGHQKSCRLL